MSCRFVIPLCSSLCESDFISAFVYDQKFDDSNYFSSSKYAGYVVHSCDINVCFVCVHSTFQTASFPIRKCGSIIYALDQHATEVSQSER